MPTTIKVKAILPIAFALTCLTAQAQGYADAYQVEKLCSGYGEMAAHEYNLIELDERNPVFKSNRPRYERYQGRMAQEDSNGKPKEGMDYELRRAAIIYAYAHATSAQDARMALWAECKDQVSAASEKPKGKGKPKR